MDDIEAIVDELRQQLIVYSDVDAATNSCEVASADAQEAIGGSILRLTGMLSQPVRNPNSEKLEDIEHYVVLKDDYVYDFTARQFYPSSEFPIIMLAEEYLSDWASVDYIDG